MNHPIFTSALIAAVAIWAAPASGQVIPPVHGPGLALALDGNFQHASTLSSPITIGPAITIETWIKPSVFTFAEVYALCDDPNSACSGTDYKYLSLRLNPSGQVEIILSPTNITTRRIYLASAVSLSLNTWTHVAGSMDLATNTGAIYINGVEVPVTTSIAGVGTGSFVGSPAIGALQVSGAVTTVQYPFTGQLDELRVWNTVVPLASIRDHMCRNNLTGHPQLADLEAVYHVEDVGPATSTVFDRVGDHHATLTNVSPVQAFVPSAAALGDVSAHVYGGPNLALSTPTESLLVSSNTNSGKHIYHVSPPGSNVDGTMPPGLDAAGGGCFGVFLAEASSAFYLVNYNYTGNPELDGTPDEPGAVLLRREGPLGTPWMQHAPQYLSLLYNVIDLQGTWDRHLQWAGAYTPSPCSTDLTIEFQTDADPGQTTWEIREQGTNTLVGSGGPLNAPFGIETNFTCLSDGCYTFSVFDVAGDGMTTGGYILRTLGTDQRIIDNRNNFSTGSVSAISGGQGFCLPLSNEKVVFTSCDKLDWISGQYVVAAPNAGVSAEWIPNAANSLQDNNSGYEFWIFDPNGSYSFRRFRSHNVSDGFGPASATRACHMKLNNWAPVSQVPANTLMNVRIRARINGVNGAFGPACRLMIDPVRAACQLTHLMDIPGNQYYSCGATRMWGTNNYVHARPVSGADRYQFRFRIAAEGFEVVRTATTYFTQLNWAVLPLQDGKTYDVDVRVSKDAGATWCSTSDPWGPVCQLTIGSINVNANTLMDDVHQGATIADELRMFPNPNQGDVLNFSLSAIAEGVHTVSVDIYDLTGKRMSARTIAVSGGNVNTVLDLQGELAAGMYVVNITAGDKSYTERLVIQP